jgi:Bacterial Ig-like domain (group 3)
MPTLTHRSRAPRRAAAAAAGALLAAGLIVVAAAAVSRASGTGPPSGSATATTLASAVSSSPVDGPVAYTATIRPAPGGGTVTFTDHAVPVPGCAAQPVSAAGTATCQAAYPSPGPYQITAAAYSGDTSYAASTSAPLTRQVIYRVQQLYVPAGPGPAGAIAAVAVELLDATGADVSGPGIPLTVTGLWPRPVPGVASVGPFTSVNVGLRPGYQLDVDTARYPAGTYTLTFTAGTDPLPHTAVFTVP